VTIRFADAFVVGELVFTSVIGAVALIFPILFKNMLPHEFKTYIFVFLYMLGSVHDVLNNIPQIFNIKVNLKRINELIRQISEMNDDHKVASNIYNEEGDLSNNNDLLKEEHKTLKLEEITYDYKSEDHKFTVGPINLEFASGEVTFITGGNGSGITTLLKLLTGLYKPDKGTISLNNRLLNSKELGEYYSAVFNDYFLFETLYGIDTDENKNQIDHYLKVLQIDKKLSVENGKFSTLNLSTGQQKRMALLVSYLDDKDIFIFDELAADQDPDFKKYFYTTLLKELKERNKIVIAITHDDHYFHIADQVVKLDMGKIDKKGKVTKEDIYALA